MNAGLMHSLDTISAQTGAATQQPAASAPWPALRQDVELHEGVRATDGSPTFVLVDPASGAYFHIGWLEFEILARWTLGAASTIAAAVSKETTVTVGEPQVEQVRRFFEANGLVRAAGAGLVQRYRDARQRQAGSLFALVLQHVMYTRVPLFDPLKLLRLLVPLATPLFRPAFWYGLGVIFLAALYMLGRQWDAFLGSVTSIASLEGAASIAAILLAAKVAHEFGHAITARHYGADVPVMGVAFVLGCPMLYTETSAAWTLKNRRQRIVIAGAGVAAEIILAVVAMLAWSLLDAGAMRNAAAFAVTTLVILTLALNANPLMRFDGYFVLAEVLGIDNLQSRAFQCVRWRVSRIFAGALASHPEAVLPRRRRRLLEVYGWAVFLYRALVYSGIILALDRLLFPALAVPLSAGVIVLFVAKPLLGEFQALLKIAAARWDISSLTRFAAAIALVLAVFLVPWQTSVSIPVVFEAGEAFDVFAPEPARVQKIAARQGAVVAKGDVLFKLESPDIGQRLERATMRSVALDRLLDQHATGEGYREAFHVYAQELAKAQAERMGLIERDALLTLLAPAGGRLTMVDPGLWVGISIAPDRPLAQIVVAGPPRVTGYAEERDLASLNLSAHGVVWLDGVPDASYAVQVSAIFSEATRLLDHPILATQYGGPIAARAGMDRGTERGLVPETGVYKVSLRLDPRVAATSLPDLRTRGFARIDTAPRNLLVRIWQRVSGLVRREFG